MPEFDKELIKKIEWTRDDRGLKNDSCSVNGNEKKIKRDRTSDMQRLMILPGENS